MGVFGLTFKTLGSRCLIVEWPKEISENILDDILSFKNYLKKKGIGESCEMTNTYNSLNLFAENAGRGNLKKMVENAYAEFDSEHHPETQIWEVPVCYDESFGVDLHLMSQAKGLSVEEIIRRHYSSVYTVYFIGFLPGFLYLGGLDHSIAMARKEVPRPSVAKGAVGIAGDQTGIYPQESPAGWNIIGNSPIPFFDSDQQPPCFARAGDKIRFISISRKEHSEIEKQVKSGSYQLKQSKYEG